MLFDQLKALLKILITDPDSVRKNAVLQNENYRTELTREVDLLTPDIIINEDFRTVDSRTGLFDAIPGDGYIKFSPFSEIFNTNRSEASLLSPGKVSLYDSNDQRYIIADAIEGVQVFSRSLEFARTFPGFVPTPTIPAANQYGAPSSAIVFTQGNGASAITYIAIAQDTQHIVTLFNWNTGAAVSVIGTVGTPGPGGGLLNTPTDLVYEPTTQRLYISNKLGQPALATAPHGFVDVWDLSIPATPVHISELLCFKTDGSLSRLECYQPIALDFAKSQLWVANGEGASPGTRTNQFATFKLSPVLACAQCYEKSSTRDPYQLVGIRQVRAIRHPFTLKYYVYVANSGFGTVEVFDADTGRHVSTYGFGAVIGTDPLYTPRYYGEMGSCEGVQPDMQLAPNDSRLDNHDMIFVASDQRNQRAVRIDRDAYVQDNFCIFKLHIFSTAVELRGWSLVSDAPLEDLSVWYRILPTDTWKPFLQQDTIAPSSTFQFRLGIKLDRGDVLREYSVYKLTINAKQV